MKAEEQERLREVLGDIKGLEPDQIDYVVSYVKANSLERSEKLLPQTFMSGLDALDYLIAPIQSNSRILLYGPPSSGKTALITRILRSIVEQYDTQILWLDSNFKIHGKYFRQFDMHNNINFFRTVKISKELIDYVRSGAYRVIVIDDIASFKEDGNFNQLMVTCKINKILVISANQIRINPTTNRPYAPSDHLLTQYDISLKISPYKKHYDDHYVDYTLKLEYNQQEGLMARRSVVIPITTKGIVRDELSHARIQKQVEADGYHTLHDCIEAR